MNPCGSPTERRSAADRAAPPGILRGRMSGFERIGHGGASALAPANTLASFDAALEVGVEMIEFDVRQGRGGLVLAHTVFHARRGGCVTLEQALSHLAAARFAGVTLGVDLKHTGCEAAVLDALRRHGLV